MSVERPVRQQGHGVRRRLATIVIAGAVACGLVMSSPAGAGSIRGHVRFTGPAPEPKVLPVTADQYVCGKEKDADDLVISADKGIRNAVVWLTSPPAGAKRDETPSAPIFLDQKQCNFAPRVVVVPIGGTVEFLNSDRLLHNIHSRSKDNPRFNRTQPKGRTIPITFSRPEIVRIDCDLHSWMRAWIVVAEHPFYAVTGGNGEFVLGAVPAGTYSLTVWQESLGLVKKDVTVGEAAANVVIEMGPR